MPKLGSPQTTKFSIGTAELRIAPLTKAMKLTQAHSVGLIDNANVEVTQESVDLTGGFPKVLVDTAVVSQTASITATLREYSRRNMQVLLGEGLTSVAAEPADFATVLDTITAVDDVSIDVSDEGGGTSVVAGNLMVIYDAANSADVSICRVQTTPTAASGTIALDADTPVMYIHPAGSVVFLANQVAIGNILETNYFAVQMLQLERATARPVGFDFWKASIGAGLSFATNAEDFASTELQLKLLQPALADYTLSSDPLYHLRDIIPTHPTGMYYGGGDT